MVLTSFNLWEFFAGLAIFLLAMKLLESALEALAGRPFKRFLRRHTAHPLQAILAGILVTALLQSSSVVSLMVLAFVGAGIIELRNAIGIIIGSNLGTTFTGWIVASLGFSLEVDLFTLPMLAIGGLTMIWTNKPEKTTYQVGRLLVGFGLLFMGLDFMKSSIATLAEQFDVSPFAAYSPYLLFIVGFALTAIIQSSSAAMVIALSALYAQVLSLEAAAAMVIGNDLGTTITVLLGSIKGSAAKKRVALSHFLFNLIVDLIALALLPVLLLLLQKGLGLTNPLLTLVAFHSSFNLLGIFIFLPLLGPFARFLERRFQGNEQQIARYIHAVPVEVTEVALETLEREIRHLVQRVFVLHYQILRLRWNNGPTGIARKTNVLDQYAQIKELEGELTAYQIALQNRQLQTEETEYLRQLTRAVRHAMAAAKTLKDISHNVTDFDKSIHDDLLALMAILQTNQQTWYPQLYHIFERPPSAAHFEELVDLKNASKHNYTLFRDRVYPLVQQKRLSDIQISTVFNLNREIHSANKSLVLAVKDLLLEHVQASDFETLPEPMS